MFTLSALGQEITDLGVITANKGIILERCTNRTDFFHFKVELIAMRWPSNKVEFTTTNELLTLVDFQAMPPGPCIMGVRSVCADSDESNISLFRVDVRRDPPTAPRARSVQVGGASYVPRRQSAEGLLQSRMHNLTNDPVMPPMPPGMPGSTNQSSAFSRQPLPGGEGKTYSQHMQAMHEFYSRGTRK
jgi:hypothetical protein